jgi:hypothetical protein
VSGFTKLSSSIVFSTVWREPNHIRIVWITMLALADARGYVGASLPGLADAARVTLAECEEAIASFLAPDRYSRTKDHEGRRIEVVDGGWRLLNHELYRNGRDPEARREQNREAQARFRERHQGKPRKPGVSQRQPESAQAEAEAEAEDRSRGREEESTQRRARRKGWHRVPADWNPNDEHRRIAAEEGKDHDRELARFRDHEFKTAKVDADATFRTWLRRDFGNGGSGRAVGVGHLLARAQRLAAVEQEQELAERDAEGREQ